MSEEPTLRDLLVLILKKQGELEERLAKVEAMAHPQSVMADPELTEMIRRLTKPQDEFVDLTPQIDWTPAHKRTGYNPTPPNITVC